MKIFTQKERIQALKRMDFDELKSMLLIEGMKINARNSEEERNIVFGAGHKARCSSPEHFTKKQLRESRNWLKARGWKKRVNMEAIGTGNGVLMQ